jgi:hypothetical protein
MPEAAKGQLDSAGERDEIGVTGTYDGFGLFEFDPRR